MKTAALTATALAAFAANSFLCRAALLSGLIDPASFSTVRIASGAVALIAIVKASGTAIPAIGIRRTGGIWLFFYMLPFSLAYVQLEIGAGALILFGVVQITMIAAGLIGGERPRPLEWAGLAATAAGFVWLVLPGTGAPQAAGAASMAVAGIAWGLYSLHGKSSRAPLVDTAANFLWALVPALMVNLLLPTIPGFGAGGAGVRIHVSGRGILLASISGALASGAGYAIWYAALRGLTSIRAAMVQLSVPLIAAAAGVILMGEPVTWRLAVSAGLILGGIGIALAVRLRG